MSTQYIQKIRQLDPPNNVEDLTVKESTTISYSSWEDLLGLSWIFHEDWS